jgi:competence protein ComEC
MWNSMPFLRLLLVYLTWRFIGEFTFLVIAGTFLIYSFFTTFRKRNLLGAIGLLFALVCFEGIEYLRPKARPFQFAKDQQVEIVCLEQLESESEHWQHWKGGLLGQVDKSVLLHLKKEKELLEGDTLIIKAKWEYYENASFPGDFDQKKYMESRGIFAHSFVKDFLHLRGNRTEANLQVQLFQQLEHFLSPFPDDLRALYLAMLTGNKKKLDTEIKTSFQSTGLMHILAVSGMHVGLLAAIPLLLLKRIPKLWRTARTLLRISATLLVWSYAFFTGLSPSICRAAVMFSFFLWAPNLRGKHQKVNILCASAFLLLLLEPAWLSNVGFQLSYSAVLGIFLLMPVFQSWWNCKYRLLKYIRDAMAVSLSAQIATLPLCLYYFHQFPSYFLLSNLVIAPLLIIIIYLLLLLIVLCNFGIQVPLLYQSIEYLSTFALNLNDEITSLPNALLTGFHPSIAVACFMYLLIALFIASNKEGPNRYLRFFMLILGGLFALQLDHDRQHESVHTFTKKGEHYLILQEADEAYLFTTKIAGYDFERTQKTWQKYHGVNVIGVSVLKDTMASEPFEYWVKNKKVYWSGGIWPSLGVLDSTLINHTSD